MNKKLCKTEFFDKEDFHNFDTTKINGKLLIYKDISQDSQKSSYNYFYYNEDEKNEISDSSKQIKTKNKNNNDNNLLNLKTSKTKENNNKNKNISKKTKSLFNFVFKDDKNKNLIINYHDDDKKYNNFNTDLYVNLKTINININRNNKTYNKNKNNNNTEYNINNINNIYNVISNIHSYKEIMKKTETNKKSIIKNRNSSAKFYHKFNTSDLAKIKTEPLKIISQKVFELPKNKICYITKYLKCLKPLKIPKNNICFYKSSYIYKESKITLPINEICYFSKNNIMFKRKLKNKNNRKNDSHSEKKDTKRNKDISEKNDTKKNKEKKSKEKQQKNLMNNNNINEANNNNNTKMRKSNISHRNEKKDLNKETKLIKQKTYFIQSNFNNYKPINRENKINKLESKNRIFSKNINTKEEIKIKNKKENKITFLPNLIKNKNKKEDSNSSSSFDKSSKNSNLLNHLLKKKEDDNQICGKKQSLNKVILHKNIIKINNNELIIPKITNDRNNINNQTQISPIISSKMIKNINFSKNIHRNNNLTNVKNQVSDDIQSYTLLDSSRQNIQRNKSMNDMNKNLPILKQDNNKLRNNYIFQYQLKNESIKNDEVNIFSGLNRNKIITLKKINYFRNDNNDKKLLAIKKFLKLLKE